MQISPLNEGLRVRSYESYGYDCSALYTCTPETFVDEFHLQTDMFWHFFDALGYTPYTKFPTCSHELPEMIYRVDGKADWRIWEREYDGIVFSGRNEKNYIEIRIVKGENYVVPTDSATIIPPLETTYNFNVDVNSSDTENIILLLMKSLNFSDLTISRNANFESFQSTRNDGTQMTISFYAIEQM
jgi:hypothetical protein